MFWFPEIVDQGMEGKVYRVADDRLWLDGRKNRRTETPTVARDE